MSTKQNVKWKEQCVSILDIFCYTYKYSSGLNFKEDTRTENKNSNTIRHIKADNLKLS